MIFSFLIFLLSTVEAAQPWSCDDATWMHEPQLEEGIFSATIQTTCYIHDSNGKGISWAFDRIQKEFLKKDKYEIHSGPISIEQDSFQGVKYDLTDKLSEEGSDIAIRQNIELLTDREKELRYRTESTAIQASGTASYLRYVSFETRVISNKNNHQVKLKNKVVVERPWFALSFLFKPLSAKITEDKFEIARNRLLEHLLSDPS